MVFEVAARRSSFTLAAQELNVQQPSVSASIKQLEMALGVSLFQRSHRRISLTHAGDRLFADVTRAFKLLDDAATTIRQTANSDHVTLSASSAFNHYWMLPRLGRFQRNHPDIDLRLQSSDREPDLNTEPISLAVRLGTGQWPGCDSVFLADEIIYPVAAPRVMKAAAPLHAVSDLLRQRLIHLEEPIRARPSWAQWFRQFGIHEQPPRSGLRLNDYAMVLQAALAGEGFAFGWHHVVEPLVQQDMLVARPDWAWKTGRGFYLVWSRERPLQPKAQIVRDWVASTPATQDAPSILP
ncbi:LysR substrate-binding domain-containing protein [Cognatishimia sp. F0-27]|uniref:LysR substrate-binding domain-containing protein n=1 Tax=Cognatishimia sp. F0-27 TaxID=2816855 RepID=UPI001D0C9B7C|nr:LysR substrate-binding domain-containing protein [Cognatishimia sp. F0-27]